MLSKLPESSFCKFTACDLQFVSQLFAGLLNFQKIHLRGAFPVRIVSSYRIRLVPFAISSLHHPFEILLEMMDDRICLGLVTSGLAWGSKTAHHCLSFRSLVLVGVWKGFHCIGWRKDWRKAADNAGGGSRNRESGFVMQMPRLTYLRGSNSERHVAKKNYET